jgi:glutamate dehydrogenase/leucine dehydrogenase
MYYWEAEEVYKRLDRKMTTAYHVLNTSKKYNINMRQPPSWRSSASSGDKLRLGINR